MTVQYQEAVRRLNRLDVCAVSDAMDKLGLRGGVSGLDQRSSSRRIAGRVLTVRLVAKENVPAASGPPRHLCTTAIEAARPGDVIVVEQRSGVEAGSWGGILSLAAKVRGVAGVICDGPVRDIDEARQYDFPVYARALTARTARGRVAEIANNQPVMIGDVTVSAGDFAIADASGIVFIASGDIGRLLDAAESIVAREAAMARALLAGVPVSQVMGADYEHMLKKVPS
ncbi:MAG: RraA family protein [Burkholderiaceae bacterium]